MDSPPGYRGEETKPLGFYTGTEADEPDPQWVAAVQDDKQVPASRGEYWTGTAWVEDFTLPTPRPDPHTLNKVRHSLVFLLVLPYAVLRAGDATVLHWLNYRDPLADGVFDDEGWTIMANYTTDKLVCTVCKETLIVALSLALLYTGGFTVAYQAHQVVFRCWGRTLASCIDNVFCCACWRSPSVRQQERTKWVRAYVHEAAVGAVYLSTLFLLYRAMQVPFDCWVRRIDISYGFVTYPLDDAPGFWHEFWSQMTLLCKDWLICGVFGFIGLLLVQRRQGLVLMTVLALVGSFFIVQFANAAYGRATPVDAVVFPSQGVVATHGFPRTAVNRILYQKEESSLLEGSLVRAERRAAVADARGALLQAEPKEAPAPSYKAVGGVGGDGNKGMVTLDWAYGGSPPEPAKRWNLDWAASPADRPSSPEFAPAAFPDEFTAHLNATGPALPTTQRWVIDSGVPAATGKVAAGASATPRDFRHLRKCLEDMAQQVGVRLEQIYLVHKFKHDRRPNAFCAGDAENRIIGLFDSLFIGEPPASAEESEAEDTAVFDGKTSKAESEMERTERAAENVMDTFFSKKTPDDGDIVRHRLDMAAMSDEMIVGVMAHELGHAKLGHTDTWNFAGPMMVWVAATAGAFGALMHSATLGAVFGAAPVIGIAIFHQFVYPAQALVLRAARNALTRMRENEADVFAAENGYGDGLAAALRTLNANVNQHPSYSRLYEVLHDDHPVLVSRLRSIEAAKAGVPVATCAAPLPAAPGTPSTVAVSPHPPSTPGSSWSFAERDARPATSGT